MMKADKPIHLLPLAALLGIAALILGCPPRAWGATANVTVGDNFFSPSSVTISANDSVHWTWSAANLTIHSSTGPGTPPLWDTGLQPAGFSFTQPFPTAGSYAYRCTLHVLMTGNVTVQSTGNLPPAVAITYPTNGATFAAPWTGMLQAHVSDTDGTVARVQFVRGVTSLGTVTNPPADVSFPVTNLAAGNYTFTAWATDNLGATTTSAGVLVHVVTPAAIQITSPQQLSPSSFQFLYTATPGLNYVVERAADLALFVPLRTNTAAASPVTFQDNNATAAHNFYRVRLLPNP